MNENEGNQQQPGGMAPPYGFMPNMQMPFFPPMQQNQMAGMQFNGPPAAPQMLPNFPMYQNPFHQMFNPMQGPPMDGQMQMIPPMFNHMQMMPPMGAPMPQPGVPLPQPGAPVPPMGGQMPQPGGPMLPMGGQMMMPHMGGPMGGQYPFVQYVIVPFHMGFPPNVPIPAPIQVKREIKEEQGSIVECTPPFISTPAQPTRRKFFADKDKEIKKEPTGDEDSGLANTTTNSIVDRPIDTPRSPTITDAIPPPESSLPPRSPTPDEYAASPSYCRSPDYPASPDYCRSYHESDHRTPTNIPSQGVLSKKTESPVLEQSQSRNLPSSYAQEIHQNHGGCDEYLSSADEGQIVSSADEGLIDSTEDRVSPPTSKWRNSFKEHADTGTSFPFDTHPTQERLMAVDSLENVLARRRETPFVNESIGTMNVAGVGLDATREEKRGMRQEEPKKKEEKREFMSNEPPSYSSFCTRSESREELIERPTVPPRFPIRERRKSRSESEDESEKTSGSISPWRKLSPVRGKPEDRRRLAACSILVKKVPARFDDERIVRYFEKIGKCRLVRVRGQPSTVRIEFVSKYHRDIAFERRKVVISKETMTIHAVEVEEEEGRKEDSVPPKASHAPPPPPTPIPPPPPPLPTTPSTPSTPLPRSYRQPLLQQPEQPPITLPLIKYIGNCELGNRDIILTAGPIPRECNIRNFIEYAMNLGGRVLDIPYPTPSLHRPHEYLIIRFDHFQQAKRMVAAQEHRVDGHVVPVSPPYDVYLRLNGMKGMDPRVMPTMVVNVLQEECGIIATIPTIKHKYESHSFGYVTFARPQDALVAIERYKFMVGGGWEFEVCESSNNHSFNKYKEVWELKHKLEELSKKVMGDVVKRTASRESTTTSTSSSSAITTSTTSSSLESTKRAKDKMDELMEKRRKKRNFIQRFSNSSKPMLTVGPIPSKCLKECDEYLLSRFDDVYHIPYEMADRNFRILTVVDNVVISEMLKEGYLRVGKAGERVLISPTFDVAFKSAKSPRGSVCMIDIKQLIPYVQRKYGPVLRDTLLKHGILRLTFARYQDAQRAIDESPHFKSLQVEAEEARPNVSFAPFAHTDMQVLINRSKEADRMELAANIRVECHGEGSSKGKRNRSMEDMDGDVLVCSPVKKKTKQEEALRVMVRVSDTEQWIPSKSVLLRHFQQFGQVVDYEGENHLYAVIQYRDIEQVRAAVHQNRVKLGGLWLDVIPCSSLQ